VQLTQRNLAAAAVHINAVIGTTESDTDVVPIPLYHAFGLGRLRCVLCAGGAVVLIQGFRLPGEIFAALERYAATGLVGVPAGFAILLQFGERGLGPFARQLRYIEIGSAPMPLEHKKLLMKLLPHTKLFMHYGLTEAARSGSASFTAIASGSTARPCLRPACAWRRAMKRASHARPACPACCG